MKTNKQLNNKIISVFESLTDNKNNIHLGLMLGEQDSYNNLRQKLGELQRLLSVKEFYDDLESFLDLNEVEESE